VITATYIVKTQNAALGRGGALDSIRELNNRCNYDITEIGAAAQGSAALLDR
jgi:hypothetical protein